MLKFEGNVVFGRMVGGIWDVFAGGSIVELCEGLCAIVDGWEV